MFNVSLPTANFIYALSNTALLIGAVLTFVGTFGVVSSGATRERFSDERIALANARAAEANQRAAEANLELARLRAPRALGTNQQQEVANRVRQFSPQKYCALLPPSGLDTESFWKVLDETLRTAGWSRTRPPGLVIGTPPAGVSINAPPGVFVGVAPSRGSDVGTAAAALADVLTAQGIAAEAGLDTEAEKEPEVIRIIVGPKPL